MVSTIKYEPGYSRPLDDTAELAPVPPEADPGDPRDPRDPHDPGGPRDPGGHDNQEPDSERKPRHRRGSPRRKRRRVLLAMLLAFVTLLGAGAVAAYQLVTRLPGNIDRISGAFDGLDEEARPEKAAEAKGSVNFLLVGSDSRDDEPTTGKDASSTIKPGGQRSDVMMLMHLSSDRRSAVVVSVPRDSWVNIPTRGKSKLNAAYSWGGPSLLIQTFEELTTVRVDHFAAIDFYGFKAVVDAIGGVDVQVAKATSSRGVHFHAGVNHLNGEQALAYVRQRYGLPQGDLDRVRRQQNLIRAVMAKVSSMNPAKNPVKLYRLLDAATRSISVDDGLSDSDLRSLALSATGLRGSAISFLTAPVRGLGREGDQSVVYLDDTKCLPLWDAIRVDTATDYVAKHSADLLSGKPR